MFRTAQIVLAALLLGVLPGLASAQEAAGKNLQVLPKTMTRPEIVARMREVASALGVQCLYCHEGADMATIDYPSDAKATKRAAREMMKFANRVNADIATVLPDRGEIKIDCITCHRGATRPVMLEDSLHAVFRKAGMPAMMATYDSLRTRYYGRFAFDFGQRSLNTLANRFSSEGRHNEAITVLQRNGELFPASWDIPYELGQAYERMGQNDNALVQYRRTLELLPRHTGAKARIDALTSR